MNFSSVYSSSESEKDFSHILHNKIYHICISCLKYLIKIFVSGYLQDIFTFNHFKISEKIKTF